MILFKVLIEKLENADKENINIAYCQLQQGEQSVFKNVDLEQFTNLFETLEYCYNSKYSQINKLVLPNFSNTIGNINYRLIHNDELKSFSIIISTTIDGTIASDLIALKISNDTIYYYVAETYHNKYKDLNDLMREQYFQKINDANELGIANFVILYKLRTISVHINILLMIYKEISNTLPQYIQYIINTLETNIKNSLR
ncbi:MAG: hypothetical protein [Wendovervirus sonii]|uniref:Uncharacterized protein n=1 Tax=phage Lak_Megaphage_Sonny TaxID=3109229 RepID=A0ABZ0Z535_9CAUD|nr:MAG: hypothetical protein [phage Lak_Megaphage_Sonny]